MALALIIGLGVGVNAQIYLPDDTIICSGTPVTLSANITGSYSTNSYIPGPIPYDPVSSATGTNVVWTTGSIISDDSHSNFIPMGFDFCFLGTNYTGVYIGSNGWVAFTPQPTTYTSATIPSTGATVPKNCIMAPWMDWNPALGGACKYQTIGTAPYRKFVVTYISFPTYSCGTPGTFQIVIHETTNLIQTFIQNKPYCAWAGGTATHGIHNATGTVAYVVPGRNSTVWTATNDGYEFRPNGIFWYPVGSGTALGTGDDITVSPTTTTTYYAEVTLCDGTTYTDTTTVFVGGTISGVDAGPNQTIYTSTITLSATSHAPSVGTWSVVSGSGTFSNVNDPNASVSGLSFGDNVFVWTVSNPCVTETDTVIITYNSCSISVISDSTQNSCITAADGSIDITPLGGLSPYTFAWSTGDTTEDVSGLLAGTYYVTVTDSVDCPFIDTLIVTAPDTLSATYSGITDVSCFGFADGAFTAHVVGGYPPYEYSIDGTSWFTDSTFSGLMASSYSTLYVRDTGLCTNTLVAPTITEPALLTLDTVRVIDISCFGDSTGLIEVAASGGTRPYTFRHMPSASFGPDSVFTGLGPGSYALVVEDSNGCANSIFAELTEPSPLALTLDYMTNVSCYGGNDGEILITMSGGSPPYNYNWSNGNLTSLAGPLSAGDYYLTVTDDSGCVLLDTFSIIQPDSLTLSITGTDPLCNTSLDGSAYSVVTGGTLPYSYNWSPGGTGGSTDSNITFVGGGTYMLTVTDANGCVITGSTTLTPPPALASGMGYFQDISCNGATDGAVGLYGIGGTPPYTFGDAPLTTTPDSFLTGYPSGWTFFYVVDSNGCQSSFGVLFTEPARIDPYIISQTNVSCFGGSDGQVTLGANNPRGTASYYLGTTYYGDSGIISGLSAGTYTVYVRDTVVCTDSITVTITEPTTVTIGETHTNPLCFGSSDGTIDITVSGGTAPFQYSIDNGTTFASASYYDTLSAGAYDIVVLDANGCTYSYSTTVVLNNPPLLTTTTSGTDVSCNGGSDGTITTTPAGGTTPYSYSWSGGGATATVTGRTAGTYYVTVTDANGCTVVDSVTITEPTAVSISLSKVDVSCNNGNDGIITASGSGGTAPYEYADDGSTYASSPTFSGLNAGSYTIWLRDANGCVTSASINIVEPLRIQPTLLSQTNVSCHGGSDASVEIGFTNGIAPYQYAMGSGAYSSSNTFSGLAAGTYMFYVRDNTPCIDSISVTITQPAAPTFTETHTGPLCYLDANGTITLSFVGGTAPYQYSVDNGTTLQASPNFNGLAEGSYFPYVIDANGCTYTLPVIYLNDPELFAANATSVPEFCIGSGDGAITVSTVGGTLPISAYSITSDGVNYTSSNDGNFSNLASGTYTVLVVDANGCTASTTVDVESPPVDLFEFTADSTSCFGNAYQDGGIFVYSTTPANGPYEYSIDGEPFVDGPANFYGLGAGVHHIVARNAKGCLDTMNIIVPQPAPIIVNVIPDTAYIPLGGQVQLNATQTGAKLPIYTWLPVEGLDCIDCPNPFVSTYQDKQYTVTVHDGSRDMAVPCSGEASIWVLVDDHIPVYIPNAFTPNNDGVNDLFEIYGKNVKTVTMQVYDRWGEKVFESSNQRVGWDGNYKGQSMNPGVYVYYIEIVYLNDRKESIQGSITLLR